MYVKNSLLSDTLIKVFFILLFLELFLMGSGRPLSYGDFTARMLMFSVSVTLSILFYSYKKQIKNYVLFFMIYFISLVLTSALIGLMNGAEITSILEDIKPLSYFLMILPFSLFVKDEKSLVLIFDLIKFSALTMASIYLVWLVLMYNGIINFKSMYILLSSKAHDISFRGVDSSHPELFYKGFLYLCVGFIYFVFSPGKKNIIFAVFCLVAIVLTLTRGFILALILSFLIKSMIGIKKRKSFIFVILSLLLVFMAIPIYWINVGLKPGSDIIRLIQFEQVIKNIDLMSIFIGHGFGIGVPIRPVHMEIAYLEIFHKQGLIGLGFWIYVLYFTVDSYVNIKNKTHLSQAFITSTLFVYVQSLTNPFLNNPIGMGVVLISLVGLDAIKESELRAKR